MNKAIMVIAAMLLLFAANAAAGDTWTAAHVTVDVNGGFDSQTATAQDETEDTVQCVPDDGNVTVIIKAVNAWTGIQATWDSTAGGYSYAKDGAAPAPIENTLVDGNGYYDKDNNVHVDGNGYAVLTIAVPTTEGLYYLCIRDQNSEDVNYDCEWIGVKPDSTYTGYTLTNSDANGFCKTTTYSTFEGKITDDTGYGKLETDRGEQWDLSADLDLDSTIVWDNENEFKVTTAGLVDQVAKVTFLKPNIRTSQFDILRNGSGCSICTNVVSNNGEISFTTSSFSTYEVRDRPVGAGGDGGFEFQPRTGIASIIGEGGALNLNTVALIVGIIVLIAIIAKIKRK